MTIALVGNGNVSNALQDFFLQNNITTAKIVVRNIPENANNKPFTLDFDLSNTSAELVLIAVKDDAVAQTAQKLRVREGTIVAHTSGSVPLEAISAFHTHAGVFYPLQTFTRGKKIDWQKISIFTEANDETTEATLNRLARLFTDKVQRVESAQRAEIHLSAVFACNFGNFMFALAAERLEKKQLHFDILKPLIEETVEKAFAFSPQNAQTGPARRGDEKVIEKHLDMLKNDVFSDEIYRLLSKLIREKYAEKNNSAN